MQTFELLDRFELLYPTNSKLADLRRAYIDKDLSSIFRLLPDKVNGNLEEFRKSVLEQNLHSIFRLCEDEDIRKLLLEDNMWKLWPVLHRYTDTQFIEAFKNFFVNDIEIWDDCFSRGQLQSKMWLVQELEKLDLKLGVVFLCAGWYATLATMIFESKLDITDVKIRSFDLDPTCANIAETFNKAWLTEDWKFKASTHDIMNFKFDPNYGGGAYYWNTNASNKVVQMKDIPDTFINTSCEHIENFDKWYAKIPKGRLVILQSNNYFEIEEHVNCVSNIDEFIKMAPMTELMYSGFKNLPKYKRFMLIGRV